MWHFAIAEVSEQEPANAEWNGRHTLVYVGMEYHHRDRLPLESFEAQNALEFSLNLTYLIKPPADTSIYQHQQCTI